MNIRNYKGIMLTFGFVLLTGPILWAYETDQGLESSISNSYVFNNYLRGDNIIVHSQDGMVTLTGTVADENHKFLAQNTAENMPNVKNVINELQIKEPLPAKYSDAWIGLKAKAVLLFHRDVSSINTRVDVKDGLVTLSGDADSEAQKELTTEYVKDINGVKGVINNMTIKTMETAPGPKNNSPIDDASITAQIELALLAHRSTSAFRTHVKTENGVVTLTGTASNDAEKSLATKLVRNINGVKDVINHMTVKS